MLTNKLFFYSTFDWMKFEILINGKKTDSGVILYSTVGR